MTYIQVGKGFVYLSLIMDAFSRKIVGWALQPTLEATKNKIFIVPKTEKSDATAAFMIIEIDSNVDYEQYSIGNRIGMDIRSGNFDLRQAVVINELLRPVYF